MPTCAIYARVSDDGQVKGDSLQHQVAFCQEVARRRSAETNEPWCTPASCIYIDEGITGTSFVKRQQVQRLIRDAQLQKFEVVLFKGISRFARDTVDALVMLRTLLACRVRIISIEENFDSQRDKAEFVFTIHSALAQAESEKTAIRVRMGAEQKAKEGKWNGQAPDGYQLNRTTKRLEIDEAAAPTIREIFSLYLSGFGVRKIADTLNDRGLRTTSGRLWRQRAISRLLQNPVYVGDVVYGRREKHLVLQEHNQPLARRKAITWTTRPDAVVVCRDAHPGIINRDSFNAVQQRFLERRRSPGRSGGIHLLTRGLLKCQCQSSMTIKYNARGTRYYRCVGQMEKGRTFCNQAYLRADELEATVLTRTCADFLAAADVNALQTHVMPATIIHAAISDIKRAIETQLGKSKVLFDQFYNGALSEDQFVRLNQDLRGQLACLRRREQELLEALQLNQVDTPIDLVPVFRGLLTARTQDVHTTRQLLELLIARIQLTQPGTGVQLIYRFAGPSCVRVSSNAGR